MTLPPDIQDRMDRIRYLVANPVVDDEEPWTPVVEVPAVKASQVILDMMRHHESPRPAIFPTPKGEIQAEWRVGSWAFDVTFLVDGSIRVGASSLGKMNFRATIAADKQRHEKAHRLALMLREVTRL